MLYINEELIYYLLKLFLYVIYLDEVCSLLLFIIVFI